MCNSLIAAFLQDQWGEFTRKRRVAAGEWAAKNPAAELAILTAVTSRHTLVANSLKQHAAPSPLHRSPNLAA